LGVFVAESPITLLFSNPIIDFFGTAGLLGSGVPAPSYVGCAVGVGFIFFN